MILESIAHQFNGDVHVGHLLVIAFVGVAALAARDRIRESMAIEDLQVIEGLQRLQEDSLPSLFVWRVFDSCGKVFGVDQGLVRFQQAASHSLDIQPVEPLPPFGAQAVVQIVAVNVSDDSLHRNPFAQIKRRPTLAGGRRPGDAISGGVRS